MGPCFSNKENEKVINGNITKGYIFDDMKLKQLNIENNSQIKTINVFSAKNNKLNTLPESFFLEVEKVKKFDLSHNEFVSIDSIIFKYKDSLRFLFNSHNVIKEIPSMIGDMVALREIDLSHNSIKAIPLSMSKLVYLESLNLSHNQIEVLIDEIIQLTALAFLNLSNNSITFIPKDYWSNSGLSKIDLGFNEISSVPSELLRDSKVSRLYLKGNSKLTIRNLRETPGFDSYLQRRKSVKDQGFDNNLDITFSLCGLDNI